MKYTITLFFVFVFLIAEAKVSIRGKILNYDGKSMISYRPTLDGVHAMYWIEVKPAPNGTFKIEYDCEGYGVTRVDFRSITFRFFHDNNARIYFEIDQSKINRHKHQGWHKHFYLLDSIKQVSTVSISGDYQEINRFYNSNIRTAYHLPNQVDGNYYSHMIRNAETPKRAMQILDSLTQREVKQIDQIGMSLVLEQKPKAKPEINDEIKKFLISEVQSFYGSIFLNGMFLKRKDQVIALSRDSTIELSIYNRSWELLIEQYEQDVRKNIVPAPNSNDYNAMMESLVTTLSGYREYDFPQNKYTLDEVVKKLLLEFDTTLFYDKKAAFAYIVDGLHILLNNQLYYSPELLTIFYDIQSRYPNSKHLAHFTPQVEKLKAYIQTSSEEFDKGIIVKGNYNSFSSLLKQFEGKNILVDVWATWCHPCIYDFQHNEVYKPLIDDENLVKLYISIDKPEWDDRWRQGIKYNKLEGYHYRGNHKFIVDMWEVLGQPVGAIPRYALVDKAGNVVVKNAFRPAEDGKLLGLINELLEKTD
jgi:thiol-disulfide isomerase/thioredoxin